MSDAPEEFAVDFGRETLGNLALAESREWIVTNGIGSYASATVGGSLTRRYRGLLVAAKQPPVGRTLLVAKITETVDAGSEPVERSGGRQGLIAATDATRLHRVVGKQRYETSAMGVRYFDCAIRRAPETHGGYARTSDLIAVRKLVNNRCSMEASH